jgi:PAS domain S-box-containing protein
MASAAPTTIASGARGADADHGNSDAAQALAALDALGTAALLRGAFDEAAVGMAITTPDGRWARVNAALCSALGRSEAELLGASHEVITHPDDLPEGRVLLGQVLAGGLDHFHREKRYLRPDGDIVWVTLSVAVVRDASGTPLYLIAQIQDITERKRVETALRASEARHQRQLANTPGVMYQLVNRPDGTHAFTAVSDGVRQLFELDPAEVLRDPSVAFALVHPDDRAEFDASYAHASATLTPWRWEGRVVLPSGQVRRIQAAAQSARDPDGTVVCDGLLLDDTERHEAAVRLEASEQRYRSLFDQHPDAVIALDVEGRFESGNRACELLSGYRPGDLIGRPFTAVLAPGEAEAVIARFHASLEGAPQSYETAILHRDGHRVAIAVTNVPIVVAGAVTGVFGMIRDLTAQQALEAQLRQAQKMEAIGRLAGGIAHDFNNLLTAILSNAELAVAQLPEGPARQDVATIRGIAERAAVLTRQLLAFSRKHVIHARALDLSALVTETERLLRRTLSEDIALVVESSASPATVLADSSQLEQVLLNLAVNAGDAMPNGGTLTLRLGSVVADAAFANGHPGLRPGAYVTLDVADTGIGIPPELQARVFEPFFTTKEPGKGTGLGLSTVYGIVKQYGGYTAVRSTPGHGTTFTVFLPAHAGEPEAACTRPARHLPRGTETVLIVEDEETVRSSMRRILELHGYTVLEASHGAAALQLLAGRAERPDLVMTDLIMPVMGGRELIAELRSRGLASKIVVISGYDEEAALRGEPLPTGAGYLEKPFTLEGLLQTVRSAIDVV